MRRIRLIIEYDGTRYVGWQRQENGPSVQQALETALFRVTKEQLPLYGSGRTDSGVHARAQVAHFDTQSRMPADKFAIAMNMFLAPDIRVLFSEECAGDFHARFSAKEKTYRYTIQTGPHARVFTRATALHMHAPLALAPMLRAAQDCVGIHDFAAFMSAGTTMENTVREILAASWMQECDLLHFTVTGTGFLYNMVRILVGTMLEIGSGKRDEQAISRALASKLRADAGPTAPPKGLTLLRVRYPGFDTEEVLSRL